MIYPEAAKLKRDDSSISEDHGVTESKLSEARTVLRTLPQLAD
jgi:hypothetical protein